uniref:ACT domain-containing protein n=1 Tax=Odontella aurita TaxID=265563 RepID=A0A7S4K295_9STRA
MDDFDAEEEEDESSPAVSLHLVVTGYVASNTDGVATTLGRDGSDYSAAVMGKLLRSSLISIWTDVDGVLSADPRRVPRAHVIPDVSYNEAMELAYFGAKVIHPKTMTPAISSDPQIPIYIRNTFNPTFRGSRIYLSSTTTTTTDTDRRVCGFSSVERVALINVEGTGLVGVQGIARRLFGALESAGVSVALISQASSEHSITFAAAADRSSEARKAIEEEFAKELDLNYITSVDVRSPCSIVAAVGDGMSGTAGVAGRFFAALGDAKINVLAVSQGCSERNISAVVRGEDSTRALRAVHAAFRLSRTTVYVGVVGMGELGRSLLRLLEGQRSTLRETFDVDLRVRAVAQDGTREELVALVRRRSGGDASSSADSITSAAYDAATGAGVVSAAADPSEEDDGIAALIPGDVSSISRHVRADEVAHSVIFDCTAEERVGRLHPSWLDSDVHVVTANNTALSGPRKLRRDVRRAECARGKLSAQYLREVTVGGGLPIVSTMRDLLGSGDEIQRVDGILSVSWSYILHRIAPPMGTGGATAAAADDDCEGDLTTPPLSSPESRPRRHNDGTPRCTFSEAVREAVELGLMEVDPVKDLSFEYTARCLMVLAKELGLDDDLEDVENILTSNPSPAARRRRRTKNDDDDDSKEEDEDEDEDDATYADRVDALMKERVERAASDGRVPRQVSSIDVKTNSIEIRIVDVPSDHVFAITPPSNECVRFFTARHRQYPLIVQGPSAGIDSTASALLAELLRLMRSKVGPRSGSLSRTRSSAVLA